MRRIPAQSPAHRTQDGSARQRRRLILGLAAAGLVVGLVYLPTLGHELVWDDLELVATKPGSLLAAFGRGFWQDGRTQHLGTDPYYRPLVNFSLLLDRAIAGGKAWYSHLVNVLIHLGAVVLLGLLARRVFDSVAAAVLVALGFGLHPMLADSVAYVSGRTDLIAGVGLLVALFGLVGLERSPGWKASALLWIGYAIAAFSKETGLLLGPVALVWLLLARTGRRLLRRNWLALAGTALVLAGYLCARRAVLGSWLGVRPFGGLGGHIVLGLNCAGRLLISSVLPFELRTFLWRPGAFSQLMPSAVASLAVLTLPLALRRIRDKTFELGWTTGLAMLVPVAGLLQFGPMGRMLYLPLPGLLLMTVAVVRRLARSSRPNQVPQPEAGRFDKVMLFAAGAGIGWCLLAVPFLSTRIRVWQDGYTLFSKMIRDAPTYATGHFNLAFQLRARDDIDGAVKAYRRAIELDSSMALAYSNLAALLQSKGQLDEAEGLYRRTIQLRPSYPLAHNNLGIVLYKKGDLEGAVQELRQALELAPDDAGSAYNLARIWDRLGHQDSAWSLTERACRLQPENPQIRGYYHELQQRRHGGFR